MWFLPFHPNKTEGISRVFQMLFVHISQKYTCGLMVWYDDDIAI